MKASMLENISILRALVVIVFLSYIYNVHLRVYVGGNVNHGFLNHIVNSCRTRRLCGNARNETKIPPHFPL